MHANRAVSAAVVLYFLFTAVASWAVPADMGGWEEGSPYNSLYKASELDRIKGEVVKVTEVVPIEGMSPALALLIDDGDGEEVMVHVGPKWFLGDSIRLKRGDTVKIRGSWAEIGGKDVFMASKIKQGDYYSLKVRLTKNGKPFWTMSEEELARERQTE